MEKTPLELLRPREVAGILNCSASYIYKLADSGILPCVRFSVSGKGQRKKETLRFKQADIERFIESNYRQSPDSRTEAP